MKALSQNLRSRGRGYFLIRTADFIEDDGEWFLHNAELIIR